MKTSRFTRVLSLLLALAMLAGLAAFPVFAAEDGEITVKNNVYRVDIGIRVSMSDKVTDPENAFTVVGPEGPIVISSVKEEGKIYTLVPEKALDLSVQYTLVFNGTEHKINLPSYYSTEEFEEKYTYTGDDLGAVWSKESTAFRVWAPTATAVKINLYETGDPNSPDLKDQVEMTADVNGTWVATVEGDLHGTYYTYQVDVDGKSTEACDPYARTTGVNGMRAMVIDLSSTNPEGWENDKDPHYDDNITDAIIYELHVRDLSVDPNSGIKNKGKFLGLIESGTTNSQGKPTGLDYIKELGVTHIHLLPSYDYATVDESRLDEPQFNWGYDPKNYNVPEGSYSTDPFNGEVRVSEFKQMVKGLHDNGISVIMDVVYNHVYDAKGFCFNQIVPQYFSRVDPFGTYSAGSGCGNDTASERSMVKKYIVDSVTYWADEYHIDGFRFDLVGLIDTVTMNEVVEEVHKTHPNVIFYGEGWIMNTEMTKEGYDMATQRNSKKTPSFAYFSDTIRDSIRGPMNNASQPGYASCGSGYASTIANCFKGAPSWCPSPSQTVNYASCHDNHALFDRITLCTPEYTMADRVKMNNLAAAIVMTSQGIPLFQAGEEILRSKPLPDGTFDHNSYKSSDEVNNLKWDNLNDPVYEDVYNYYKGLIAFRKAHPALRMTTAEEVEKSITVITDPNSSVLAFQFEAGTNGETNNGMYVIFNPKNEPVSMNLPEGEWTIYINGEDAGTTPLGTATGSVTVDAISAMVLVSEPAQSDDDSAPVTFAISPLIFVVIGAVVIAAAVVVVILIVKKRKNA